METIHLTVLKMYNHPHLKLTTFLTLFLCSLISYSQQIENISAVAEENKIIVTYDLIADDERQEFDIGLYSSVNNYSTALRYVTGAVGKKQSPGTGKKITWDPSNELTSYEGEVTFEIRATLLAAPVSFTNPVQGTVFKRGKIYEIRWTGTNATTKVHLEIFMNGQKIDTIGLATTDKKFSWFIPKDTKPGSEYQLNLKAGSNSLALSPAFSIKGGIPLAMMVGAPAVAVGTVVGVVLLGGGEDEPDPVVDRSLPPAPDPGSTD